MKKLLFLGLCALVCLLLVACGGGEWQREELYVVQQGDSLYSIAVKLGVEDWRAWSYEVCRKNGLLKGGEIFVGDQLLVPVKD